MPHQVNAKSVTRNIGWSVLSKTSTFGLKFVTVPILARILSPEEFGAVAVALTIVQFLAMIGGAGLSSALIAQREEEMATVHSAFWANLAIACLMAVGLYVFAHEFATILGAPQAAYLLQVLSLLIPLQLGGDVAYSLLARRMKFGQDATWNMLSEVVGAVIAVLLALFGAGVWALVAQLFAAALIRLVGLYAVSRYTPRFVFHPRRVVELSKLSLGMMGAEMANFVSFQSPQIIISRYLGLADAGAYSAANRVSSIPNQVVLTGLMGVLFPAFSNMMHDRERRSQALMLSTQVTTVLLAPMMFGLWALAEPSMLVLFGHQWAYAWPVLGLLALSKGILTPCSTFIPYLKGAGFGGTLFWWAIVRAIVTTLAVAYGAIDGTLIGAMIALCIVNVLTLVGYSWVVFRVDGTPFFRGFFLSIRPMMTALVMAVALRYLLDHYGSHIPSPIMQIGVGAIAGGMIYAVLVLLTERPLLGKLIGLFLKRRGAPAPTPAE
ncbi:lipopolysaccharide biosynthesis protein [Rhizobiaceae bacterium n13]|uniref:Lipopolysaccharide biosynthesis protein n=1 Tax=Ferirhizobium litorale TaxID=2927786 RepID=A0AAE3QGB9_9HYPH|nr:lipopolysaccharide biosynthesis protein [Fererhizobium litorale]MDI7862059.1 lipopolysaccharide biosynthesis protein [Fererhizobium litorale]MDI7922669.1 lipopolysaccharide biosynthesis protein [Fererhizobium litorale]